MLFYYKHKNEIQKNKTLTKQTNKQKVIDKMKFVGK